MIKTGHYGEIELCRQELPEQFEMDPVGVMILRKAPKKYHDKDEPEDSKVKVDAVYLFEPDSDSDAGVSSWIHLGNFIPSVIQGISQEIEKQILVKLTK